MAAPLTAAATTTATVSAAAAPSATVAAAAAATVVAATATATAAAGTSAGQAALEQSSLAPADEATVAVPSVTFFLDQKEWTAKMYVSSRHVTTRLMLLPLSNRFQAGKQVGSIIGIIAHSIRNGVFGMYYRRLSPNI